MANRFLSNININDEYTLPSADGTENQIIVTDGAGNLSFDDLSTVTGKVEGVEAGIIYYEVKNSTGTTIDTFKGVMAVGTDGNSGHILIDEMVADGTVEARYFLGITQAAIPNGGIGRVIAFGEIDQVNTNAFPDGTVLWCDPANPGDFTATEPDGPNLKIPAAFVLNQATNGKIQVRVQSNEGIKDLYDTKITSQVDGDVLVWDNTTGVWFNDSTLNVDYTNSRVGIGTTSPDVTLEVQQSADSQGLKVVGFDNENNSNLHFYVDNFGNNRITSSEFLNITSGGSSSYTATGYLRLRGVGTSSQIELDGTDINFTVASSERMRLTSTGLGIGTTSPSEKLHVQGNIRIQSDNTNGHFIQFRNNVGAKALLSNTYNISGGATSEDDFNTYVYGNNPYSIWTNNNNRFTVSGTGNVGIGTTSPSQKLHVAGNILLDNNQELRWLDSGGTQRRILELTSTDLLELEAPNRMRLNPGGSTAIDLFEGHNTRYTLSSVHSFFDASANEAVRITATGNVGIGTTNPADKLHVGSGAIRLDDNYQLRWGGTGTGIYGHSSQGLNLYTKSGSTRLKIDNDGNVGIGTTNPLAKLHVNNGLDGTTVITNSSTDYSFYTDAVQTNTYQGLLGTGENSTVTAAIHSFDDGSGAAQGLIFSTGNSTSLNESIRIKANGNVGIGTTSPLSKLQVNGQASLLGNGFYGLAYLGGTNALSSYDTANKIVMSSNGSTDGLYTGGLHLTRRALTQQGDFGSGIRGISTGTVLQDNALELYTSTNTERNATRLKITSTGNVGIGTTSPSQKLQVSGNILATGNITAYGGANDSSVLSTLGTLQLRNSGNTNVNIQSTGNSYLNGGNVGIGTTSPSHKLTINASNDTTALGIDFPSAHFDFSANSTSGYTSNFRINDVGMDIGHDSTARSLNLQTGNQDRLTILGNGNVGIGTINPPYKLSVQGTTYVQNGNILISGGTYRIANVANISQGMGFPSLGNFAIENVNVGIGTTSPSEKLEVNGNASISGGIYVGGVNSFIWNNTANSNLRFGANGSEKMRIASNGNVGIGTTSPNEKLEVNGSVRVKGAGLDVGHGNNSNNFVQIGSGRTTNGFAFIDLIGDTTYSDYGFRISRNNGGANTNTDLIHRGVGFLNLNATQAGGITLKTSNVERVRVNSSGNVGIGTTSPATKLHVFGTTSSMPSLGAAPSAAQLGGSTYGTLFSTLTSGRGVIQQGRSDGAATSYDLLLQPVGGNVGIGTSSARTKLHVSGLTGDDDPALGSSTAPFFVSNTATTYGLNIGVNNAGASWLQAQSNTSATAYEMSLNPLGGNVGVGFINPSYKLDVNGTGRFTGNLTCLSLIQTSQRDQKKDIADIDKSKAKAIPFKEYKYKSSIDGSERKRYGVVVEDIENYYPELVHTGADGVKGINYIDLLVKRVAELEKELEDISLTPGPKGSTGPQGPQGATGATGSKGATGAAGNSHLSNVDAISFDGKAGQLIITINKTEFRFNPAK